MMRAEHAYPSHSLKEAALTLQRGELVVVPSETVYGLAANAYDPNAVLRIFDLKKRPSINPLIVHYASYSDTLKDVVWTPVAKHLAKHFWPGPLTLVMTRKPSSMLAHEVSAGLASVAVRVPSHAVFQSLLKVCGCPLAAPSANPSGLLSPTKSEHIRKVWPQIPLLEGGASVYGLESTVIDVCFNVPYLLRLGALAPKRIEACLKGALVYPQSVGAERERGEGKEPHAPMTLIGPAQISDKRQVLKQRGFFKENAKGVLPSSGVQDLAPLKDEGITEKVFHSPGLLPRHYAPQKPLRLHATSATQEEALLGFGKKIPQGALVTLNLSEKADLNEAAQHFFDYLWQLDQSRAKRIAVMPFPAEGLGLALQDRLKRAIAPE